MTPRWLESLTRRLVPADRVEDVLGDLEEVRHRHQARRGRLLGTLLAGVDTLELVLTLLLHRRQRVVRQESTTSTFAGTAMESVLQDLHFGLKLLARERAFSLTVLLTLGVCIGANVAIYGVIQSVLLRPLPFEEPDRLVTMHNGYPGLGAARLGNSIPDFFLRRERLSSVEDVALYVGSGENVSEGDRVQRVPGLRVTPSFFPTLGVEASLGRTFVEEEMESGRERSVILTDGYWRERFGASENVIGQRLEIDGQSAAIIGVLPGTFRLPTHPDVRLVHALQITPAQRSLDRWHSNNDYFMLGRLAPGATVDRAEAEIAAMNAGVADELGGPELVRRLEEVGFQTVVVGARQDLVRNIKGALFLLWVAVGFVLLIGCVNIANLMLVRSEARLPELATRVALGAGRRRLARQIMTEAAAMGLLGGVVGSVLGWFGLKVLTVAGPVTGQHTDGASAGAVGLSLLNGGAGGDVAGGAAAGLDVSVLLYAVALALGASVLIGLIPIVTLFGRDVGNAFHRVSRTMTVNRRAVLLRGGLVVAQVALAFVLLVGAGLMLRSFRAALDVDPGFEAAGVLTAYTALTGAGYPDGDAQRQFYDEWLREVQSLPGVAAAGVTTQLPFGPGDATIRIVPEGYEPVPGEAAPLTRWSTASRGYFAAMGIDVLDGRVFEERDGPDQPNVVVIDEWLARRYWPDSSPLGRRMTWSGTAFTVIGVAETIEHQDLTAEASLHTGAVYFTYRQRATDDMGLVVRTAGAGALPPATLRAALDRVDPAIPLFDVRTLEERLAASLGSRRTPMILLLLFAGVALFLAVVGIYGVLAYSVVQRRREIGIRMALGSQPTRILRLVLKQGLVLIAAGLAAGAGAAFFLVRLIQSLLFGIQPLDPAVLAGTAILLGAAAVIACFIPARRAT
ncbi:MAG: ADOP family duplicated permease, partial [Longimicrobiales bacterium]